MKKRIVVGISGASGAIYGIRLLEVLKTCEVETHLVVTKSAKLSIEHETELKLDDVIKLADHYHNNNDIAAKIASGSFIHDGMIIAPCTVKTLSEIATGCTSSLISRAADVALKDRRRLVLLFRETPLHLGHIKSMQSVTEMGGIIMPPVTSFYNHPKTTNDIVNQTIGRLLDLYDIKNSLVKRWGGI
ncbi:MAG: UbiX family flavin prenyltransferase [Candidatus Jidaibacter sp.]|jgi:4-hydroxy-3-polyprenylbenzoate decarboxylase|nr:UbiX family flavin prenyltransferase [Candidatus Jidaibacter sp.]